jgi:IS5 family transposase
METGGHMEQPRFKSHTTNSFFGHFLYSQVVDKEHFLVKATTAIDWDKYTKRCLKWYQGHGEVGRPPYNPVVVLKMLFLSYLYNLSERQVEQEVNDRLSMKYFLGLGADEVAPDHSTLTYFKERLLDGGGIEAYTQLLQDMVVQAQKKGIIFGKVQVVDATHTTADVNTQKDHKREKDGKGKRDPDAKWGTKHSKLVKDPATGETKKIPEHFHGYKAHLSYNPGSQLITSVVTTSGEVDDGGQFPALVEQDNAIELPPDRTYAGDKGYDYGDNHELLKEKGLGDALRLKKTRTEKKDPHTKRWEELEASETYQKGGKERYKIEQKNGEGKRGHGLRRCRYVGLARYHVQTIMTAWVLNLKVVVARSSGVTLRGYSWSPG